MGEIPLVIASFETIFDRLFLAVLALGTLGYVVMQVFQLMRRSSGTERILASLPLLLTVPVTVRWLLAPDPFAIVRVGILGLIALSYLFLLWLTSHPVPSDIRGDRPRSRR
jgi:hypothetical protein